MKAEEVVIIGATGAAVAAVAHQKLGISTGNALVDAALGIGLAFAGWYTEMDGISDFVEGVGIGYAFDSVF